MRFISNGFFARGLLYRICHKRFAADRIGPGGFYLLDVEANMASVNLDRIRREAIRIHGSASIRAVDDVLLRAQDQLHTLLCRFREELDRDLAGRRIARLPIMASGFLQVTA